MDGFVGNEGSVRKFEDCITIANSGSVGSAFFHQYEFVASDHVTQLKRKGLICLPLHGANNQPFVGEVQFQQRNK